MHFGRSLPLFLWNISGLQPKSNLVKDENSDLCDDSHK
jgi:hypothetical protein